MQVYYTLMIIMAVLAVIVFIALFKLNAGYGYLSNSNWGAKINNKLAWVLMESPTFFLMLYYTLHYAFTNVNPVNDNTILYIMAGLFLFHYFQRSFIFPLKMRGKSTMPIAIMLMGVVFNTLNSYFIGKWLFEYAPAGRYTAEWISSPQFIIGTVIFFSGMLINLQSDHIIRTLRKPGDTKHYIPRKGLYKYVTSANYFGELTEWVGYAILTWSLPGVLFAVWTFANLGPRARSLTHKYEEEFGDEYKKLHKKHLIPYIW